MTLAILLIAAYVVGGIPFGVIVSRAHGIDIFSVGSGNPGATNVIRALGKGWGSIVFVLDVTKGVVPVLVARQILPHQEPLWALVGMAAVLGHCASPFLRFRGGKGISTILGAVLATSPYLALLCLSVFVVSMIVDRFVSLSSILAVASSLVFAALLRESGPMYVLYGALTLFVVIRHKGNLARLKAGTEPKFRFSKTIDVNTTVSDRQSDNDGSIGNESAKVGTAGG